MVLLDCCLFRVGVGVGARDRDVDVAVASCRPAGVDSGSLDGGAVSRRGLRV